MASNTTSTDLERVRDGLLERLAVSPDDPGLLVLCARTEARLGRHVDAAELFSRAAVSIARSGGALERELDCRIEAAAARAAAGTPGEALSELEAALARAELVEDPRAVARVRLALARVHLRRGAHGDARVELEACIAPMTATLAWPDVASVRAQLAALCQESGDLEEALRHARATVEAAAYGSDQDRFATALTTVAGLHHALGRPAKARGYLERALPHLRAVGDVRALLAAADVLGTLAARAGEVERAERHLLEAALVADRLDEPGLQARQRARLGELFLAQGDGERARRWLEQATSTYQRCGNPRGSGEAHRLLGVALVRLARTTEAGAAFTTAEELLRAEGDLTRAEAARVARGG